MTQVLRIDWKLVLAQDQLENRYWLRIGIDFIIILLNNNTVVVVVVGRLGKGSIFLLFGVIITVAFKNNNKTNWEDKTLILFILWTWRILVSPIRHRENFKLRVGSGPDIILVKTLIKLQQLVLMLTNSHNLLPINCLEIGLPSISLLPEGYKYHWSVPHSFFCSW